MKFRFHIILFLLLIYTCDRQLIAPVRDNPFDSASGLTDHFNLHTKNFSDHILVSWEYTYDKPVVDSYLLYRIKGSDVDTLYAGIETNFTDSSVEWDSTYSYYVTGMINEKETPHPEIADIPEVLRRIYVGISSDYTTIGDAINALKDGDIIYVNNGTYMENIDFNGKAITLRSVNGPENTIIDGNGNGVVVTINSGEDENNILYGFTIRNGMDYKGGGVHIDGSSPIIRNCIIENNTAKNKGGGIFIYHSFALIDSCIIRNNGAERGGGIYTGATRDELGNPIFQNCEFTGNTSTSDGGGAYVYNMDATFKHCDFLNNQAEDDGGGLYLGKADSVYIAYGSFFSNNSVDMGGAIYFEGGDHAYQKSENSTIINTIFSGNYGKNGGGAIYSIDATPTIIYSTFWNNSVDIEEGRNGGGIHCDDGSAMMIMNSILWDNVGNSHPEIYFESIIDDTLFTIDYSNIKEGHTEWWFGEDCLDANPLFEDSNSGDFHLKEGSPCIGTDSNNTQMGAYGGEYGDWR